MSHIRGLSSEENHPVYLREGSGNIDDEHYNDDDDYQNDIMPSQGEGDDRSLTDTLPEDSVSVTGSEINTPNTIRKGTNNKLH